MSPATIAARARAPRPLVAVPPRRPLVHHAVRLALGPAFRAYFGLRAEGVDRVPRQGAYLLAPNHVSMLDWAFLSYFLPRQVRFLVDRAWYDHPILGRTLRWNGAVPVAWGRPDRAALRTAEAVLAAGEPLVVFPEGAISDTGRPQQPRAGVIRLAAAARAPIVPVAVRGAFEAFPRWRRLPRPGRVTVVFGRPQPPPPARVERRLQQTLAERLMAHIAALLDGEPAPEPPW